MLKSFLAPRNKAENVILEIVRWVCRCERIEKKSRPVKDDSMRVVGIMYLLLCNLMHVETENHAVAGVAGAFDFNSDSRNVRRYVDFAVSESALYGF